MGRTRHSALPLSVFCASSLLAILVPVSPGQAAEGDIPLEERVQKLEQRVQALESLLEPKDDEAAGAASVSTSSGPEPGAGDGRPGWATVIYPLPDVESRPLAEYRGLPGGFSFAEAADPAPLARWAAGPGRFSFNAAETDGGHSLKAPVLYAREADFKVDQAGWYRLTLEFTFPDAGAGGFLGGFNCPVTLSFDDHQVLATSLRQPYSQRNRIKIATGSANLEPGWHRVRQTFYCEGDGRQAADPLPAIREIAVRSLLRSPGDRDARVPVPGRFQLPADTPD